MVKANELRIGNNLIYSNDERLKPELRGKLLKVTADDILFLSQNDVEHVQSIPLTEEWLVKLGFKKQSWNQFDYRFDHVSGKICGYVIDNVWCLIPAPGGAKPVFFGRRNTDPRKLLAWNFEQTGYPPGTVHQLQNLYFALTGEELEVEE